MIGLGLAFRNLQRNRRRTATALLTVALGTGAIFLFHGFNAGIMNQYRENAIHAVFGYGQIFTRGYREQVFEQPWDHWITDYPRLAERLRAVPGVEQLFPRVQFFALLTNGHVTVSGKGLGVLGPEEASFFSALNVVQGVALSDQTDGVELGVGLARALGVRPGDRITALANTVRGSINGVDLTVVGIFHTGSRDIDDALFRLPLAQAQVLLDTDRIESVSLGLRSLGDWDSVARAVATTPELEAVPFAELDRVYYQHSVDWLNSQFRVIELIILTIVLLGILNTVATAVLERKQEIGNLRANGDSVADVLGMLFWEGLALGMLGSLVGLALATLVGEGALRHGILMPAAPGITRQFHVRIELQPLMAVRSFVLGSLAAAVATLWAGLRVTRMPIGKALRSV